MEVNIDVSDGFHGKITKELAERVKAAVAIALHCGAEEVAAEAKKRAPKAFSTLTNSIKTRKVSADEVHVVAGVRYAMLVERGTPPGSRSTGTGSQKQATYELGKWATVKGILNGRTSREVAFLIWRKIQKSGTKANPFMSDSLETKRSRINQVIKDAIANATR